MTREEVNKIYNIVRNEYSDFNGDYNEWYEVLCEYSYQDVLKRLQERKSTTTPTHTYLIKNLKKEEIIEDWITECDYCKTRFTIQNNDMTEFDKHYRKCQKIDFIDRMTFKKCQRHIPMVEFYNKTDEDLESAYRKAMNYYIELPHEEILKTI